MGTNAKNKATLSGVVSKSTITLIDQRREKLTLSRSTYLTLIVEHWIKNGCPPLNEAERAIEELKKIKLPKKETK